MTSLRYCSVSGSLCVCVWGIILKFVNLLLGYWWEVGVWTQFSTFPIDAYAFISVGRVGQNYYNYTTTSWLHGRHVAKDWCVRDTHPPAARALSVHLSLLEPPPPPRSVPLWCYLWVCVSVGRRWRSVWLNSDKETNSSANRHIEEGERRRRRRRWRKRRVGRVEGVGSAQNKTDKR